MIGPLLLPRVRAAVLAATAAAVLLLIGRLSAEPREFSHPSAAGSFSESDLWSCSNIDRVALIRAGSATNVPVAASGATAAFDLAEADKVTKKKPMPPGTYNVLPLTDVGGGASPGTRRYAPLDVTGDTDAGLTLTVKAEEEDKEKEDPDKSVTKVTKTIERSTKGKKPGIPK